MQHLLLFIRISSQIWEDEMRNHFLLKCELEVIRFKRYVALFSFAAALHWELFTILVADAFKKVLKRSLIKEDNGTNFVGANPDLKEVHWCASKNMARCGIRLPPGDLTEASFSIQFIMWWVMKTACINDSLLKTCIKIYGHVGRRSTFSVSGEDKVDPAVLVNLSLFRMITRHYFFGRQIATLPSIWKQMASSGSPLY